MYITNTSERQCSSEDSPGKSGCSIVHACDNYPTWADSDKAGNKDPNQEDLQEPIGVVSRLDGIMALCGTTNFFGTPFFLRVVPITDSYDYVNENSQRQD